MSADDGSADPRLAAALRGPLQGALGWGELLAALLPARVFTAIAATSTAERVTEHGLRAESSAQMAVLLLEQPDGRRALPVFTDLAQLARWNPQGRPVPLSGELACRAALEEGAGAVLIDPAGPAVAVQGADLHSLADGFVPVPGSRLATRVGPAVLRRPDRVPPGLVAACVAALAREDLLAARLLQGEGGLVLGVSPRAPLGPEQLTALAQRVLGRLADAVPPEGLDLAQVPVRGPGVRVLRTRRWSRRGRAW